MARPGDKSQEAGGEGGCQRNQHWMTGEGARPGWGGDQEREEARAAPGSEDRVRMVPEAATLTGQPGVHVCPRTPHQLLHPRIRDLHLARTGLRGSKLQLRCPHSHLANREPT